MKRIIALFVVFVVLSSTTISLYATKDMFNQIEATPISFSEELALGWMIMSWDQRNYGFYGQLLYIMIALHLDTFLWVTYPWDSLPPVDPWLRK